MEAKKDERNTGQSHTISYLRGTEEALIVCFEEIRRIKIKAGKPIRNTEKEEKHLGLLFLQYSKTFERCLCAKSIPDTVPAKCIFSSLAIKDTSVVAGNNIWILQEICRHLS